MFKGKAEGALQARHGAAQGHVVVLGIGLSWCGKGTQMTRQGAAKGAHGVLARCCKGYPDGAREVLEMLPDVGLWLTSMQT